LEGQDKVFRGRADGIGGGRSIPDTFSKNMLSEPEKYVEKISKN
jgi:hypothetical protein